MLHGYVRWFNDAKGYGLIDCEETGESVYVHFSDLEDGNRTLRCGDKVRFEVEDGRHGQHAREVHRESEERLPIWGRN